MSDALLTNDQISKLLEIASDHRLEGQELIDRVTQVGDIGAQAMSVVCGYVTNDAEGNVVPDVEAFTTALNATQDLLDNPSEEQLRAWAENAPKTPYKGDELLERCKALGDVSKAELVIRTGYYSYREDGTIRLHFTDLYENLLTAKGIDLGQGEDPTASLVPEGEGVIYANDDSFLKACIDFGQACGVMMRKISVEMIDQHLSGSDIANHQKAVEIWSSNYKQLQTSDVGLRLIYISRMLTSFLTTMIQKHDLEYIDCITVLNRFWDEYELKAGGVRGTGKCSADVVDSIWDQTTESYGGLAKVLAFIISGEYRWDFNNDKEMRDIEHYYDKYKELCFMLNTLNKEDNYVYMGLAYATACTAGWNIAADNQETEDVIKWTASKVDELCRAGDDAAPDEYDNTLEDDCLTFAISSGYLLRRHSIKKYGVTEFSDSDNEAKERTEKNWAESYKRLTHTTYGIYNIAQARDTVCQYYGLSGSTDHGTWEERVEDFKAHWDSLEKRYGGINKKGETSEVVADELLADTSKYNDRVCYTLANVMRTDFSNHYLKRDWALVEQYHKDVEYISEQLVFLQNNNVRCIYDTAIYALASAVTAHPLGDNFDKDQVMKWVVGRVSEIKDLFPSDKKAEGRW